MRLRERATTRGGAVVVDDDDTELEEKVTSRRRVMKVMESESEHEDEVISDDSSNLDDDVPLATKLQRRKKKAMTSSKEEDGNRKGKKAAAPKDSLLKYLQPNVSNVKDWRNDVNAGSDSDDVFDGAPPLLQAGRRKRKVVAHPRENSGTVSSDDDEDEDDRPLKKCSARSGDGSRIVRASTRPTRQSKVSYKESSSGDELQEEPSGPVPATREKPEGDSDFNNEDNNDDGDLDFTDFDVFAFTKSKAVNKCGDSKEDASPSGVKCYSRLRSKTEDTTALSRSRRVRGLTKAAKAKNGPPAADDGVEARREVLRGPRRTLRDFKTKNLKDASSSDEESEGLITSKKADTVVTSEPHQQEDESECSEEADVSKSAEVKRKETETYRMLCVGVYGLEGDDGDKPVPITKRIGRVEKILSKRVQCGDVPPVYCVKEYGKSYRDIVNVCESTLLKHCPQLIRNFLKRLSQLGRVDGHCLDRADSPAFDPLFTRIERIISHEVVKKRNVFLVKWCRLPYTEVTWVKEEDLTRDRPAISRYYQINKRVPRILSVGKSIRKSFMDGRALRDYQEAGVTWLDHNFENRTNCVLADEMGLGKTIQSVAMLETLRCKRNFRGPFLVIAPVSTLGHWQREIESLTDMNCVVYTGNQEDRDIIRQYEFHFNDNSKELKFNVLLTSFEMLMRDQTKLSKETWQYIVVDEAHRLKSNNSKTTQSLRQLKVRKGGLLLLTGTPVQNNTKELFSLLNLLDSEKFSSEEEFLEKYGEIKEAEQIKDLQNNILRPRLLRRLKEDVEKSIPQKEETIVWVELTKDQRVFYKAIFENNVSSLLKGSSSSNLPNLRNVAMELRKLCNHPFLCDGLEESLLAKNGQSMGDPHLSANMLHNSSGKMVLVDKLLPKLKDAGRRVLIFSQFTIMLDLLEDYMNMKGYSYERIDGKIRGSERQAAIDRYSAKDSEVFVFLLSTRAGGLGITLTAADTCIIYDSDWNPQNDLQAMARCHRIGQTKDVKIYRLITRNTYEERLFECSSRKYGLDEAILGNRLGEDVNLDHDKNIESLLKHGAYDIMKDDGEEAASEFKAQDIDQILEQRTQQRQIGGRGNNTFSVATFRTNPDAEMEWAEENSKKDSKEFWQELLPEACDRALVAEAPVDLHVGGVRKRTRGRVNYYENQKHEESSSDEMDDTTKNRNEQDATISSDLDTEIHSYWSEKELKRLEDRLFALGRGRTGQIRDEARLGHRSPEDIEEVSNTLIELCQSSVDAMIALTPDEVQAPNVSSPLVSPGKGEPNQLDTKSVVIPASAKKVLESQVWRERVRKNAQRLLQQLHERKVLAEALQIRAFDFMDMPLRSKKLPSWWGTTEDVDLLRGAYIHGHRDFKKIRSDKNLIFVSRNGQSLGSKERESGVETTEIMPSDQVLGSRLRNLIEALPNGLTAHAQGKRALKNEQSRKCKAKAAEQRKLDEVKKSQPIMSDKNLAEWVTSSPISTKNVQASLDKSMSMKTKLKVQAREVKKTPAESAADPNPKDAPAAVFNETPPEQPLEELISKPQSVVSPRKPLSDLPDKSPSQAVVDSSGQKRQTASQENKLPKKRKLSLSAGKASAARQTSLKSFLKAFPIQ